MGGRISFPGHGEVDGGLQECSEGGKILRGRWMREAVTGEKERKDGY